MGNGSKSPQVQVLEGLQRAVEKDIPCSLLYDDRGSELYEQITELDEYYPFRVEECRLKEHAREICDAIPELEALSMMDKQVIDKIAARLVSLVPPGLADAQQDLRANFQDVLAQGLRRLDLVTREEFDVQSQVLARTRAKVDELERRVAELEAAIATRGP
jgi:BMFP domain-containing protein YqiC